MRLLLVVLAALVALFAGYWVYWTRLSEELASGLDRWIAERRAEGYVVEYAHIERRGFPSRVTVEIHEPEIARPDHPNAWRWRADWLEAWAAPWDLGRPVVRFDGRHRVDYRDAVGLRQIVATAGTALARLTLDSAGLRHLEAEIRDLEARPPSGPGPVRAGRVQARVRVERAGGSGESGASYHFAVQIDDAVLPEGTGGPLGRKIDLVGLAATVLGVPPRRFDGPSLGAWRDAGGALDVRALRIEWGGVEANLEGRLALDDDLRPAGVLDSKIWGGGRIVEALVSGGRLGEGEGLAAKAVLGLLARIGADGRSVLEVPVATRQGRLFIGPVPVLRLIPLADAAARSPVPPSPDRRR